MRMFIGFFIPALLCLFAVASAQLPPEIMVDKYLIEVEQLLEKKDYAGAFKVMEKIIALQKEHSLISTDMFYFKYAQIALKTGSIQTALDAVKKYLATEGQEGEFYKEALALLIKAEKELEELVITPEKTCNGKSVGSSCWLGLTNHPECYVWEPNLRKYETVAWSGECSGGLSQGKGTLIKHWHGNNTEETGYLQNGKKHGHWIIRGYNNLVEGPYVNGKKHGEWVYRYSSDSILYLRERKGSYVDGKMHGEWIEVNEDGGRGGGAYVNGKKYGKWVEFSADSGLIYDIGEGSYVNGLRQGHWIHRDRNDVTLRGPYVDGKMHGEWVFEYYKSGNEKIATYVNGVQKSERYR